MNGLRAQRRRDSAAGAILLTTALTAFLLPLVWTASASSGLHANNSTRPPSWLGSLTLDHFSEVAVGIDLHRMRSQIAER